MQSRNRSLHFRSSLQVSPVTRVQLWFAEQPLLTKLVYKWLARLSKITFRPFLRAYNCSCRAILVLLGIPVCAVQVLFGYDNYPLSAWQPEQSQQIGKVCLCMIQ